MLSSSPSSSSEGSFDQRAAFSADAVAADRAATGPLSVIGIGTFAARGISGIASGGTLDEAYIGGCVIAVRRVASCPPPAAGTTMGTFGPLGLGCCCDAACGDVSPVSVLVAARDFGSTRPCVEVASEAGALGPMAEPALALVTLVTEESSSTGLSRAPTARVCAGFMVPTSSGIVDAGTHSVIPGRQTSVDRGRTLFASAERSSSVRTSR